MIHTATQLKAKIKNIADGSSTKSQTLLRNFIMERFLERISLSPYRDNFILKGGMLVSALVGLNTRATMDIDTTVKALPLNLSDAASIVNEIIAVPVEDGLRFEITKAAEIMDDFEYPGIRFMLEGKLDKLCQAIKIDISTGDVITPDAVMYEYHLMFENRTIPIWTYNTETLLAEKMETILARSTANTRMRDFYDIHIITTRQQTDTDLLRKALNATAKKRGTSGLMPNYQEILRSIESSSEMLNAWNNYRKFNYYVMDLEWHDIMASLFSLFDATV